MVDRLLAAEINAMAAKDQRMRKRALADRSFWDASLDRAHTRRLKAIIKDYGWPTRTLVGKKASHNAWLIAQHADHDLAFQKRALRLMQQALAADSRSVALENVAYLMDRTLVAEGKPQEFGTQFFRKSQKHKMHPRPVRDRKRVNERRAAYGLPPYELDLEWASKQ